MILNPLADDASPDTDRELVEQAQAGSRDALEQLITRHQRWIYNIVQRMIYLPQDAEDITQEILIKLITKLSTFKGDSRFRTWLYRIVVNHVLNMKRGRIEHEIRGFPAYGEALDATPDLELPDPSTTPEVRLLVTEVMISCVSGMLLCLDREQRLTYILGDIFGVTDTVGAELLEISRENFRQRLVRARRDLHNFMHDKCGLVNRANPCRCVKKTRGFIQAGHVDPQNLLFVQDRVRQVREVVPKTYETIRTLDDQCADLYRQHPFYEPPDLTPMLRRLIESAELRRATELP